MPLYIQRAHFFYYRSLTEVKPKGDSIRLGQSRFAYPYLSLKNPEHR